MFLDDIVVSGGSEEEQDKNLKSVLDVIKKSGLKLNEEKCVFGQKQIEFLGHIISAEGIRINPEKVTAILNMDRPSDVSELRRLLGMVNFLARFCQGYKMSFNHLPSCCLQRMLGFGNKIRRRHFRP